MSIETIRKILEILGFIILYFIIGFGPGFIVGILLANRFPGRDKPTRFEKAEKNIMQAAQHNKQWHPDDPRWQK